MSWEELLLNQTFIPPEPKEVETKEVKVTCTVFTYLDVPGDLENRIDIKDWIEKNYDLYNNLSKNYIFDDAEIFIEDIDL